MSKLFTAALVAGLVLMTSAPAFPQAGPLVTDRPDFTESASTVAAGLRQLEFGVTAQRVDDETLWTAGEVLLRLGLSERWELRLLAPSHQSGPGPDGFADGGLGAKLALIPEAQGARPATAVIFATSVPSGEAPFRSSAWQPEVKLCLAWDLAEGVGLAGNLNFGHPVEDGRRFAQTSASLSLAVELAPQWGGFFEWFGYSEEVDGGDSTHYLNTGITWLVQDDFQLDARVGRGLGGETAELFAGLGAAIRF